MRASDLFWIRHFPGVLSSTARAIIVLASIFSTCESEEKAGFGFGSFRRFDMIGTNNLKDGKSS